MMQLKLTTAAILGQIESGIGKELTATRRNGCNETAQQRRRVFIQHISMASKIPNIIPIANTPSHNKRY